MKRKSADILELKHKGHRARVDNAAFCLRWNQTGQLYESMLAAGYSPKAAKKGRAGLNKALLAIVDGKPDGEELSLDDLRRLGDSITTPQEAESIIKGFVLSGLLKRNGKGVDAAKLLAQLKSTNLLSADATVTVIDAETVRALTTLAAQMIPVGVPCPKCGTVVIDGTAVIGDGLAQPLQSLPAFPI